MRDSLTRPSTWVRLLDVDPDLGAGLGAVDLDRATSNSAVGTWALEPGRWREVPQVDEDIALYIIAGGLARHIRVGEQTSVEILGPGQVLRPRATAQNETVAADISWHVLLPSWLAVLDHTFWRRMGDHPAVLLALMDQVVLRSRSLAVRLAIVGIRNLPRRVLALLWHLADSYGRVSQHGVMLDLSLSHEVLAHLVSARRSSVSKALKDLEEAGFLSRGPEKRLVLHGEFPALA